MGTYAPAKGNAGHGSTVAGAIRELRWAEAQRWREWAERKARESEESFLRKAWKILRRTRRL